MTLLPPLRSRPPGRLVRAALALAALFAPGPAGAFTWGNLVVTRGSEVVEYRTDGMPVAALPVPFPPGTRTSDDPLGGIAFDSEARLCVYNGAAQPSLSIYEAATTTWTHVTHPGWTTFTTAGLAGLATSGRDVFASDFGTLGGPERGVIAFDGDAGWTGDRIADLFDIADVATGPDGRVHALLAFSSVVSILDPGTRQEVDRVTLEGSVQAIAVAADGSYFGCSGDGFVRHFTPLGVSYDTLDTAIPGLTDIALGPAGDLVLGTALGEVVLADPGLGSARTFLVGGGASYVAWVPYHATTPARTSSWGRIKAIYRR